MSTDWLAEHLGEPGVVVVESDEDVLLYETGHIPGAVKIDWHTDLNDPDTRDYIDGKGFAQLLGSKGIARDTTIVVYGDKNNWWAAYAAWVFTLFGHEDVRLLDGGRGKWIAEGREVTTDVPEPVAVEYPVVERDDVTIRAFKEDVLAHIGNGPLVDIRSPQEYTGERLHIPDYPEEGVLRGGHIPTARNVPWATAVAEAGSAQSRGPLAAHEREGGRGRGGTRASVGSVTERQLRTPPALQGRVAAASTMLLNVPQRLLTVVGAALVGVVDYRALLVVTVAGIAVAAALALRGRRAVVGAR